MKKMSFIRNAVLSAMAFTAVSSAVTPSAEAIPVCRSTSFKSAKLAEDAVALAKVCGEPVEPVEPKPRPPRPLPVDPPVVVDPAPVVDCSVYDNVDHYVDDANNPYGLEGYQNDGFGFCNETTKKAYHDQALQCEKPIADWVCQVVTAAEVQDPVHYDSVARRCRNVDKSMCRVGAGGEQADHRSTHVESGACYVTQGSADLPDELSEIRCCCGCFPGDVQVLSTYGYVPMNELEARTSDSIRLAIPRGADSEDFKVSDPLHKSDLVVGPEEKPVLVITTDNGATLTLTDLHPVLTVADQAIDMKQARELAVGDVLFTETGEATEITDIGTRILPVDANDVFNVYVPGAVHGDDHVIVANELRTGDRAWQDALSARSSFEYALERAAAE